MRVEKKIIEGSKMGLALSRLHRLLFRRTPFSGKLDLDAAVWNTYADYYGKLLYYFSRNLERREACVVFRPKGAEDADVRRTFMGIVTVDGFTGFWGASCKLTDWNPPQDGQEINESLHPWNLFSLILVFFDYAEEYVRRLQPDHQQFQPFSKGASGEDGNGRSILLRKIAGIVERL